MTGHVFGSYVDGVVASAGDRRSVEAPALGEPCGSYACYTPELLDQALAAAQRAFGPWSRLPVGERVAWMHRLSAALTARRDEIIELLIAETGKPLDNAVYDFEMLPSCLDYFAEEIQRLRGEVIADPAGRLTHHLVRHPVGVVVGFLAWNFPLLNLGYKLGPVLAAGCTCILKPSRLTPLATARVGEIVSEIGFPAGVVNIVLGDDREVAARLLTSTIPALVTMIGSTEAGCDVVRTSATSVKRYSLELGGNAPVLVYPDFDPAEAAELVVGLKLANSGQVCVSPNRCFVHRAVLDTFCEHATRVMASYHLGAGDGPTPRMGPLITSRHRDDLLARLAAAVSGGARVLAGGSAPPAASHPRGYYLEPTLVLCDRESPLCRGEIFGPILPVIPFGDDDDLLAWANDCPHGLAAYVFTHDLGRAQRCAEQLEYGSVCINEPHFAVHLPHGGMKQSGVGKDCSHLSLEEYLVVKRVTTRVS